MSFIIVKFGEGLERIFSTNCIVSTLVDAIKDKTMKDMIKFIKTKDDFFTK